MAFRDASCRADRCTRAFEWRAPLGPWRWLILGALGIAPEGCGARAEHADLGAAGADLAGRAGAGGSAMPDAAGAPAAGGSPGDAVAPEAGGSPGDAVALDSQCVPESSLGGNWVRCTNGMLHRAQRGTCEVHLPRADHEYELPAGLSNPDGGAPLYQSCRRDTDCGGPYGHCESGQGGPYCVSGCVSDDECDPGQVCLCGPAIGECRPAHCAVDSDCGGSALCGSYDIDPTCGGTGFACQTSADECAGPLDCGSEQFCTLAFSYPTGASGPPTEADHRTCSPEVCNVGRPFLVDGTARLAPSAVRSDWYPERSLARAGAAAPLDAAPALRAAVARGWVEQASMEHASVAAFARFSLQLMGLGAPAHLIEASATAMQDEIRHARDCFALARRHLSHDVGPAALAIGGALDESDLESIVLGTLREGCIGETVAALEAAEALEHCEDLVAREVLQRIAVDEARHAELAWLFVAWALETGPASLVRRVRDAFVAELAAIEETDAAAERPYVDTPELDISELELARHGLLSSRLRSALRARCMTAVIAPCARGLLARARTPDRARHGLPVAI